MSLSIAPTDDEISISRRAVGRVIVNRSSTQEDGVVRKKSTPHAERLIVKQCWITVLPGAIIDADNSLHSKEESRS
jgi:hypothetical protein